MREDWIECKLEDLLDYEQPTKYIIQEEKYNDEFPIPVLTAGKSFIKGYTNEDFGIFDNLPTIIFDDFTTASQFVNFKFKVKSSAMKILVPTSKLVNLKFAFGAMQVNKVRSETHKRYWISEYSKLSIGLPPLVEQRAIVKKLESLFSSLDAGVSDLKKAQQQLKIYRQAVLKKAFEGELTKTNSDWIIKRFEECTVSFNGKRVPLNRATRAKRQGEFRYYGATEIVDYIDDYIFDGEFLLIGEDGANLLSKSKPLSFIVDGKFWVNNHAHIFKPNDNISIRYLNAYFNSLSLNEYVTGTAQPKLTKFNLCKIPVKLPLEISDQLLIVKEIESRLSICDSIEQNIKESLEKAEALRQSVLKKAFEGNLLTLKERKECKLAEDYEPASVLLEKIKAAKEASKSLEKTISRKPKIKMDKKEILVLLKENNNEMAVNQLWKGSIYENDIDTFYLKLKELSEQGKISEIKNGKEVTIKLI
ncbi:restriction endonuclease subunit S [Pedobacter agri]|uniref:restriction endonuclease subunit S n=1 Tax=Pedobacter agri TaxID=454586 RepID=UPI00292F67D9|nr:restriction endonuclease subunit S [Pedobacter agri]